MGTVEVVFAVVVTVLAAMAVIGALVFAVVWEVCAIRRTLAAYRRQPEVPRSSWREHSAVRIPERRP
jgi:hypothetical protein